MTTPTLDDARRVLREHWGFDDFKSFQREVITHVLDRENVLAVIQTGAGKSACFQIPAMLFDGTCLVFSPLIALMQDQVQDCLDRGIPASFINSQLEPEEVAERIGNFVAGAYKLFYVAPERLSVRSFQDALVNAHVSFIAGDEIHCVSRWGSSFRPDYARLYKANDMIERAHGDRVPMVMLTATCTAGITDDIVRACKVDEYKQIIGDPIRSNIIYRTVHPEWSPWSELKVVAREMFDIPGRHLIYAATRNAVTKIAEILSSDWPKMGAYHAGMEKDRDAIQEAFKSGRLLRMSCTNAFGMGIDVPDIRSVTHFGIPGTVEDYVQEVGRGGRDGKTSAGLLIHDDKSVEIQQLFIDGANPPTEFYPLVWDFLGNVAVPGQEITLTPDRLAKEIQRATRVEIPPRAVGTVLNILDRHGLVKRRYMKGQGSPVTVYEAPMRRLLEQHPDDEALQGLGTKLLGLGETGVMDSLAWQRELGLTPFKMNKAKKVIKNAKAAVIGRAFTGKSTTVPASLAGERIEHRLPLAGLQAKREHDMGKLRAMQDYAQIGDLEGRRDFIRSYFMDEPEDDHSAEATDQLAETMDYLRELKTMPELD